jgi:hypothetical protein
MRSAAMLRDESPEVDELLAKAQTGDRYSNYILRLFVVEIFRRHQIVPLEIIWILAREPTLVHDELWGVK